MAGEPGTRDRGATRTLAAGWGAAVLGAVRAAAAVAIAGEVLAFVVYAAGTDPRPSVLNFLRLGTFLAYGFHHVGVVLEAGSGAVPGGPFGGTSDVLILVPPLAGTLLALWLLAGAGRAVAEWAGASGAAGALHGAKVAVPYALAWGALSFAVAIPAGDLAASSPSFHPSHLPAFLWPLGLALLAGAAGGLGGGAAPRATGEAMERWAPVRAVVAGGATMLGVGLALAFLGLVALAPLDPESTRAYFGVFDQGALRGIAAVVFTMLMLPNLAAFVLVPAMGGCLTAAGALGESSFAFCVLSYTQFPTSAAVQALLGGGGEAGGVPSLDLPAPSPGYYLFALAPLLAVVAGGAVAAARAPGGGRRAARAGAAAGAAFAVMVALAAVLATARLEVGPAVGSPQLLVRVGPEALRAFLVALAWGVPGGAAGGWLAASRRSSGARRARPSGGSA